jgi:hypothetical protein
MKHENELKNQKSKGKIIVRIDLPHPTLLTFHFFIDLP